MQRDNFRVIVEPCNIPYTQAALLNLPTRASVLRTWLETARYHATRFETSEDARISHISVLNI